MERTQKFIHIYERKNYLEVITMAENISTNELKQKIGSDDDFILVDALSKDSFKNKRIPGSVNIPSSKVLKTASDKIPNKQTEVVVYCASNSCEASTKAVEKLEELGYKNVVEFNAGLKGWLEEGYDLEGRNA